MIDTGRVCGWLFAATFGLLLPAARVLSFFDELCVVMLLGIALADVVFNGRWRQYGLLWLLMGVMSIYAFYSLTAVHYNTASAIALDWLLELKPYVPFAVFLAVRPRIDSKMKRVLRVCAIVNVALCAILFMLPGYMLRGIAGAVYYPGGVVMLSAVVYAYASDFRPGEIKPGLIILAMLAVGLASTRSKYYGEAVLALFFLFLYRPGIVRGHRVKAAACAALLALLLVGVGWNKISYYFLTGESTKFDANVMESYARPVLYATGALVLMEKVPLGSGLASFGSFASTEPYSDLYHEYGISRVHGLSPSDPAFACDAFYPSLAQFGIVGVGLFIAFWVYVARRLRLLIRGGGEDSRTEFACGWILVAYILIESIAGTTFVQSLGMCAMMMLGAVCCGAKETASDCYVAKKE